MKISRFEIIYFVRDRILGKRLFGWLQEKAKYYMSFRNLYSNNAPMTSFTKKTYVFMIDGKTKHGGLSDRLRGLFSVYAYSKEHKYDFKICWIYPFKLQDYLNPADNQDWVIEPDRLSYNHRNTEFIFVNSHTNVNNDETEYFRLLDNNKIESHVYSNVTILEECYKSYFEELFKLDSRLESAVDNCLRDINGSYVSVSFRFIGLLGDFQDDSYWGPCPENERDYYVNKCISAIQKIKEENLTVDKILVTSDSSTFINKISTIPYVYIIPGDVAHIDNTKNSDYSLHLKTFVDFILISKAVKCYFYSTGKMFGASKFARTAALIGGKNVIELAD